MHFEDKFVVDAPAARLWKFITNPKDFVKIIPDVQEFTAVSEREFKVAFKVGVGMVRGTIKMAFHFEDLQPPASVKVIGRGTGLQSSADLTIALRLEPQGAGTLVSWSADLVVGGLVVSVGSRLLESTTEKKIREIVEGIRREVK